MNSSQDPIKKQQAMNNQLSDLSLIIAALSFASEKHRDQRRKDQEATPYINHPIEVARLLHEVGGITDGATLAAALLHDTVEDTDTTSDCLLDLFGEEVAALVLECTDDKTLAKEVRKLQQIEHAPNISVKAKHIKLADKISNVRDMGHSPPPDWSLERRIAYIEWGKQVVSGLRGCNQALEMLYDHTAAEALNKLNEKH
ncbi:MAG: HD domain-containing protein [Candidatus Melainabacteria bacterium]|nr:HD domain-containing protein [Candidatus Melainabacteria bacterium]